MRMQLGKHPANSHGKLRAAIVGHGRLCSMSGGKFGLDPWPTMLREYSKAHTIERMGEHGKTWQC